MVRPTNRANRSGGPPGPRPGPRPTPRATCSPLLALLLLLAPPLLRAQNLPDNAAILERLDRLEQENRAMAEEIRALRAELTAAHKAPTQRRAPPPPRTSPKLCRKRSTFRGSASRSRRQTKVESSQKFPIALAGMALVNAFINSRQNGRQRLPHAASAIPATDRAGATARQSIIGLEYHGPRTFLGGTVHGSMFMDFYQGPTPLQQWIRLRTATIQMDWKTRNIKLGSR